MRAISIGVVGLTIACACLGACASDQKEARSEASARIDGPYVAAGTQFAVVLERELGTSASPPGTTFDARVRSNLITTQGQTLVPAGAVVRGRVVDVDFGVEPTIKLVFDTISTVGGDVPIAATVKRAQEYVWIDPGFIYNPSLGYEAILYHPLYHPGYVPPKPTPPGMSPQAVRSGEFAMPQGAELTLALTGPLLGPSAHVKPAG